MTDKKQGQIIGPSESSHSVDLGGLPKDAIKAIIEKLNQRSQRATRVFKDDYDISVNDLKQLMSKIVEEFNACSIISNASSASVILSKNQRFDFSSWTEFENFDQSQPQTTKSLTFGLTLDVIRGKNEVPERYSVQVSIQNNPAMFGIQIGPFGIRPVDSFEMPPAPLVASINFNNYILGKNIISTIEDWEKSLKRRESPVRKIFQKWSSTIRSGLHFAAALAGIYACNLLILLIDLSSENGLAIFILWSAGIIYTSYKVGSFLAFRVERQIDRQVPQSNITLTDGDRRLEEKRGRKNAISVFKSALFFSGIVLQIVCSIAATKIFNVMENIGLF
ncbi:MAG: hypothetical protein ACSHXW_20015 [Yoonia sp.]